MIEFRNVTGLSRKFALKEISFQLEEGYMLGIMGANGAGKTTLMRYMLDPVCCYRGEIIYGGRNIRENHEEFLQEVGYISEDNPFFKEYTSFGNADLLGTFYPNWDEQVFKELMNQFDVPLGRHTAYLSRGEFMKFQLAFAIAHQAKLFLIDEATAGMDPIFRREFYHILRSAMGEDAMAIVTSHIQGDIDKNMDYIGLLEQGRLISYKENLQ